MYKNSVPFWESRWDLHIVFLEIIFIIVLGLNGNLYDSKKRKIISTISIISVLKETKTDSPIHREIFFIIFIKANRNQIAFTICCPFGSKKIGAWKIQSDFGMI